MRFRCYYVIMFLLLPTLPTQLFASQLTELESGKVVFSFSLEAFQQAWQLMNQILSAPYEDLDFSAIQSAPSRGRFVEASLANGTRLFFYLDLYEEYITSISLITARPTSNFEQILLSNLVAMLLSLLDHEVERSVYHRLATPLYTEKGNYVYSQHHGIFYVSFNNNRGQYVLNIIPQQYKKLKGSFEYHNYGE